MTFARVVAALIAAAYLLVGLAGLFMHAAFGWTTKSTLQWLTEGVFGAVYFFGVAILGIAYARHPFRNGLAIVIAATLVPWLIATAIWWLRKP